MAGQKKTNQAAKKAASDGKISGKEAKAIMQVAQKGGGNAALAIANQVARGATANANAQRNTGLQIKGNTIAYDPKAALSQLSYVDQGRVNYGVIPNPAPDPVSRKFTQNTAGTFTYLGGKPAAAKPAAAASAATTPAAAPAEEQNPMNKMTDQWGETVDSGMTEMQAIIEAQIKANSEQAGLYMGMMQDMMAQMQAAQQQQSQQPQAAYAVTTSNAAPAQGATQTQAIAARKKPLNTILSIDSAPTLGSGVGTNLAI